MRTLLIVLSVVSLVGCSSSLRVGEFTAKPNINLKKSNQTLGLKIGDGVKDAWQAPGEGGAAALDVSAWTTSLTTAFAVAFEQAFTIKQGDSDLVLEVQEADVKLVPGSKAQVRYKAKLVDRGGKELALTSGSADSKTTCDSGGCVPAVVGSAVETMYEQIAEKLFAQTN